MSKWAITALLLFYIFFGSLNIISAANEEEEYQIKLEKRQEYCSSKYTIYIHDSILMQPLEDLKQNNINKSTKTPTLTSTLTSTLILVFLQNGVNSSNTIL